MAVTVLTDGAVTEDTRTLTWTIPTLAVGDVVVVTGETWDQGYTLALPSGTGLTFTERVNINIAVRPHAYIWSAVASSGGTNVVVTSAVTGGNCVHTGTLYKFPTADGYSLAATPNTATASFGGGNLPQVALTGTSGNTAVIVTGDWSGNTGSVTWLGDGVSDLNAQTAGSGSQYFARQTLTSGSTTVGMTAPTATGGSVIGAMEVLFSSTPVGETHAPWLLRPPGRISPAGRNTPWLGTDVATATDGTATPAVIAVTAALPAASASSSATTTPAVTAATLTLPAPTLSSGGTATPATTAATLALPAPTTSGGGTGTPAPAALTTTIPAVTTGAGGNATPSTVSVTVTLPAATPTGGGGATVTPDPVTVAVALPAPTTSAGSTASPTTITTTITLPAATLKAGSSASPQVIPVTITLPAASASGVGQGTASPDVIACTASLPAATESGGGTGTPATVPLALTFPAASAQAPATATPAAIPITMTTPTVTTRAGGNATPGTVAVLTVVPNPGVSAGTGVNPATIALAITLATVIASGQPPDPNPITITIRDAHHTVTVTDVRHTATARPLRNSATTREQR